MYPLDRISFLKCNLEEDLALYGGNLDFLDKLLTLANARTKNLSKKSQFPPKSEKSLKFYLYAQFSVK